MLTVILKILSILGILLLILLGVLLLVILLVLFVPVTYRVHADRQEAVHLAVKADWLLGFLRVRFRYPEPGNVTVKLLFFTLFDFGAQKKEDAAAADISKTDDSTRQNRSAEENRDAERRERAENHEEAERQEKAAKQEKAENQENAERHEEARENRDAGEDREKKQSLPEKIRYTFQRLCARIKELWENYTYYRDVLLCEDTRGLAHHALTRIGRILKSIRPRKLQADIRFGTGSPDTTGYVFGIYGMFCSCLGKQVILTPDFEQAILVGELDAAGHITIFKLLWHGLWLVMDRRLWELMDKFKRQT